MAVKHRQLLFHFTQTMITRADYQLINAWFLARNTMPLRHLHGVCEVTHWLHNITIPHMYFFSYIVNLHGNSSGTALHMKCGLLEYESGET